MPRAKHIPNADFPYNVTGRVQNKNWYKIPMPDVWSIMEDYLFYTAIGFEFKIHAFVLMNNHFHLMVSTPQANLSAGMQYFMRETSRQLAYHTGIENQKYGSRYYRCLLNNYWSYMNVYKYIYRNPVEAGICKNVEDYTFSTLKTVRGESRFIAHNVSDSLYFEHPQSTLSWLNKPTRAQDWLDVKNALRRSTFQLCKGHRKDEPHRLESNLL